MRSLCIAQKKVINSVAECLKVFPNLQALRFEQKLCLLNLTREKDPFVMLPTGFGKSVNFQLLPRAVKALQCCDTSVHTAYNIASPGTIYSLNFIAHTHNYYVPLHAIIVTALSDNSDEREKIQYYAILSYANTWQGIRIHQLSSIKFLHADLVAFEIL